MTTSTTPGPLVLDQAARIREFLLEASKAKVVVATRRGVKRFEASGEPFAELLEELGRHTDHCRGAASLEMFGASEQETLGHAPAWVDAGGTYEALLADLGEHGAPDIIVCLDPWTAQLIGRVPFVVSQSRWVFVSDLDFRRKDDPQGYWKDMSEWFRSLPFSTIIPRDLWERAVADHCAPPIDAPQTPAIESQHLGKPGAWQWRRISGPSHTKPHNRRPLLLLVRFSGSVSHLKVFLDSLSRLEYPKEHLRSVILLQEGREDVENYLKWYALAHPGLCPAAIEASGEGRSWEERMDALLSGPAESTVILVDDHVILPRSFARDAASLSGIASYSHVPLSLEATAHVITGNLDPVSHYENLLQAFVGSPTARLEEGVRVLPAEVRRKGGEAPFSRIRRLAQEPAPAEDSSATGELERVVLRLVDRP